MTIAYDIDVSELEHAAAVLADASELVADVAERWVDDVGADAEANVRRRAGRHRVTGAMESHIRSSSLGDGISAQAIVRVDDRIAALIVRGTAAHTIEPRAGKVLSLAARGAVSFARRVRHPGTEPDPFVARALDDTADGADTATIEAGDQLAGELADELTRRA